MAGPDAAPGEAQFEAGSIATVGLFPTPLIVARLDGAAALNAALAERIMAREKVERGVTVSNVGGWHSKEFLPWSGPDGARVIQAALALADRTTLIETDDGLAPATVAWRVAAWANIGRVGDSHKQHAHPGAFWSGIYWIDDGGADQDESVGGLLELADPRGILPAVYAPHLRYAIKDCLGDGRGQTMTPSAGTMVLFPAWLIHGVTPYRGPRVRLSVAFNLSL